MNPYREAIKVLRRDGWKKYSLGSPGRPVCLTGALRQHTSAMTLGGPVWDRIDSLIREHFPERISVRAYSMAPFNDHPDTTLDDVILVLEKTAIQYDEQEVLR